MISIWCYLDSDPHIFATTCKWGIVLLLLLLDMMVFILILLFTVSTFTRFASFRCHSFAKEVAELNLIDCSSLVVSDFSSLLTLSVKKYSLKVIDVH